MGQYTAFTERWHLAITIVAMVLAVLSCRSDCPFGGDPGSAFCPQPQRVQGQVNFDRGYPCGMRGESCPLPGDCLEGIVTCVDGRGRCSAVSPKPAGSSCKGEGICDGAGLCVTCAQESASCVLEQSCAHGRIVCDGVGPKCEPVGPKTFGTPCDGGFCDGAGECTSEGSDGDSCSVGSGCAQGVVTCFGGACRCVAPEAEGCAPGECVLREDTACPDQTPDCTAFSPAPAGTACTEGRCDSGGACMRCTDAGQPCAHEDPCKLGVVTCASEEVSCGDGGNAGFGTPCGDGGFCDGAGQCISCENSTASEASDLGDGLCQAGSPCFSGRVTCDEGVPACAIGNAKRIGETCGNGGLCDIYAQCVGDCGDRYVDVFAGERCDDGNRIDGDGCSADCRVIECGPDTSARDFELRLSTCYWREKQARSRQAAADSCRAGGGYLIRWDNGLSEAVAVYDMVSPGRSGGTNRVFIGASWDAEAQAWRWDNGATASEDELNWQQTGSDGTRSEAPHSSIQGDGGRVLSCIEWGGEGWSGSGLERGNALNDQSCGHRRDALCERATPGTPRLETGHPEPFQESRP